MDSLRTVVANAVSLSAARILNPLTSLLLVSAVARTQGAEGLGQYSLVLTIFYMAVSLAGLGLATPITRAVAVNKEKTADYFSVTTVLGLVCGVGAILVVSLIVVILDYPVAVSNANSLLMWAVVPSVLILHYDAIFMAHQKAQFIAGLSVAENVIKVAVGLTMLALGYDVTSLFFLIVVLRFASLVGCVVYFRTAVTRITPRFSVGVFQELWQVSPIFTTNLVMATLLGRVDILLLSKIGTLADVGYYGAALRIIEIARLIPFSVKRAALPAMCGSYYESPQESLALFHRCMNYMAVFGFGAVIGILAIGFVAIRIIFGDGFSDALSTLHLISLYMIPASLTPILACILFSANLEKLDLVANLIRVVVLVIFCATLIPALGKSGAAIALTLSEVALFFMMHRFIRHRVGGIPIFATIVWPAVAAVVAALVFGLGGELGQILRATLSLATYVVLVLVLDRDFRNDLMNLSAVIAGPIARLAGRKT